jgi:hypothetical protein
LGNLGQFLNSSSTVHLPYCRYLGLHGEYCTLDNSGIAVFYGRLDFLGALVVAIGYLWLRYWQREEQALLDRNTITPSDYTVCVTNLPKRVTEEEIRRHFMRLLNYEVVSVNIAYDNEAEILAYQNRGALVKEHYEVTEKIKFLKTAYGISDPDIAAVCGCTAVLLDGDMQPG